MQMSKDTRGLVEAEFASTYYEAAQELNGLENGLYERFGKHVVDVPTARDLADLRSFVASLKALAVGFDRGDA